MNCKVKENALLPKLHYIVDAKDTNNDKSLHIQNSSEKVISNELQIDMQSVNKFENELDVAGLFVDNEKGQCKEAVGHQLRFKIHSESNKDNDTNASIQPEYDASIDDKLPETVTLLTTPEGGKLYLVGTAHFSVKSQNDVAMIIQAVQPHIVAVELCEARINIINITEEAIYHNTKELDISRLIEILKCYGVYYGLLHIVLYRMMARLIKEFGMPPGGEFRTAFKEAKKIPNCIIQLADRSINVTFLRTLRQLSWWEIIKLVWLIIQSDSCISIQDIEHYKQKCVLKQMILSLREKYPTIEKTFITERDIYLTYHLQEAIAAQLTSKQSPRVVAVVGIGHTDGIIKNWGKVEASDILPIMWVPPQRLSSKIFAYAIRASFWGATIYVGYKIIPLPSTDVLKSIRTSIARLLDEYEHITLDVMYVVHNIPGPGINLEEFESEYALGCSCTIRCFDCSCTRGSPNYIDGRILDEKLSVPIIECNSHCTCSENCDNRVVQNGPLNSLIVLEIDGKGHGLFTSKPIKKGRFICEYAGEVVSIEEAKRRIEANKNTMNYVLVVSEHIGDQVIVTCIDPKYFGNIGRYANHSCEPNVNLVPIRVEGPVPRLCLFASRDIKIDEEITFNYAGGVPNSVHKLSHTPCLCDSKKCCGYLPHNTI